MGIFAPPITNTPAYQPLSGGGVFGVTQRPRPVFGLGVPSAAASVSGTAANFGGTPLSQYMMQQQIEALAAAGMPTNLTAEDLAEATNTPEAARASNETKLAQIATANPQLAEELAAKMQGEGQDQSLWDNIKDIGKDVLGGGMKLLEIVGRPARIVPELILDEENDTWYEDVAQALSGNSRATGAKVLESWGVENGWAKGVGGFAFDVLADPLTWLTFGTAGLGRRIASEAGGTIVAKTTLRNKLADGVAGKLGVEDLDDFVERFGGILTNHAGTASVSADALPGLVANSLNIGNDALSEAVMLSARRGDEVARAMQQGSGIKKVTSMDELAALREVARGGVGAEARQAAAALGGIRVRAAVPFTRLRTSWVSQAMPGTEGLHLFGPASNFFRGTSGMTRLTQHIQANPNLDPNKARDMMQTWMDGGFAAFQKKFPTTASEMSGGKALSLGSGYLSVAHRMGKVTAHMNPHANLYRHGGLAGIATMNAAATARSLKRSIHDSAFELSQEDDVYRPGTKLPRVQRHEFAKLVRPIRDADPEIKGRMIDMMEAMPSRSFVELPEEEMVGHLVSAQARIRDNALQRADIQEAEGAISPARAEAKRKAAQRDYDQAVEQATQRAQRLKATWDTFDDDQKNAMDALRRGFNQIRDAGNKHGAGIGALNATHDFAHSLQPLDVLEAAKGGRRELDGITHELYAELPDGVPSLRAMATHKGLGRGVKFTSQGGDNATRIAMRVEEPLILREGADQLEGHNAIWQKWEAEIRETLEDPDRRRLFAKNGDDLTDDEIDEIVAEALTDRAQRAGFDAVVRYGKNDEVIEGTYLMDPKSETSAIWAVDENAPRVVADEGYLPHLRSPEFRKHEEGEIAEGAYHPGDLMHAKHRKSAESLREMNARLKADPNFSGEDALITDPLRMFDLYATHVAEGAAREVLGLSTRRVGSLYGGGANEMVTWLNRYATDKGFMTTTQLAAQTAKAREVYTGQSKRSAQALETAEKINQEVADRLRLINEEIAGLGKTRVAGAMRSARGSAVRSGVSLGSQKARALMKRRALQLELKKGKDTDRITDQLASVQDQLDTLDAMISQQGKGYIPTDDLPFGQGKAMARAEAAIEKRLTQLDKRKAALEKRARTHQIKLEGGLNELGKIRSRMEAHMATPTPAFTTDGSRAGYVRLDAVAPQLQGLHAHPYIAKELESALAGRNLSALQKQWRQWVNGPWKSMATVYFPGFHVRNNMGAWFNSWLGGTGVEHYRLSQRLSRALDPESKWHGRPLEDHYAARFGVPKGTTYHQMAEAMHNHGVRGSNSLPLARSEKELEEINALLQGKASRFRDVRERTGDALPVARMARGATEITENWHRQAAMLRGLEVSGGNWGQARAFTMMRHGDYEDLNDFEEYVKDLVPFYKWMRTNLPFQIRQLLENPGKQLATVKAANNAVVTADRDPDKLRNEIPDWMSKTLAFPLRALKGQKGEDILSMVALDLPLADLSQGLNDYLGSMLPVVLPFIENEVGMDFWTKAPIEGKKKPVAGWMELPVISQILETLPGVDRNTDGKLVMDDRTANTLGAVPIFGRFRNWVFADDNSVERRMSSLGSAIFGVRMQEAGPAQLTSAEKEFYYNEIEPVVNELRELGVTLPEPAMVSPSVYTYLGFTPPAPKVT